MLIVSLIEFCVVLILWIKTWRLNLCGMHVPSQRGRLWHPCTSLSGVQCGILCGTLWNTIWQCGILWILFFKLWNTVAVWSPCRSINREGSRPCRELLLPCHYQYIQVISYQSTLFNHFQERAILFMAPPPQLYVTHRVTQETSGLPYDSISGHW